jgi:preprotein translocase subunit SecY
MTIVGFAGVDAGGGFMSDLSRYMTTGHPVHMIAYASLIAFFAFFYTAVVFNPEENAEMLRKYGGFVPGVRPGKNTAEFLDHVLTRITVLGAAYLCFICLMPEYLISHFGLPFYFGGTSLLIVVSVTMDTVAQINSHMLAHQYEGLIKKTRLGKGKK